MPLKHQMGKNPRERKPKSTFKVVADYTGSKCGTDNETNPECPACFLGADQGCVVEYAEAKTKAQSLHEGRRLVRVRTRHVLVSGEPFHKAKPYVQGGAPVVRLRRTFIFQ